MTEIFYIYVDGSDLDSIAQKLRARIEVFAERYRGQIRVVDQRKEQDETSADLPDWDLGVNFGVDALTETEQRALIIFFHGLSVEFDRDFAIGGASINGQTDDFIFITADKSPDKAINVLLEQSRLADGE